MKNNFPSPVVAKMAFGFAAVAGEIFLSRRTVFEDQDFLCGLLLGAGILLLLQAVCGLSKNIAASHTSMPHDNTLKKTDHE